MREMKEAAAPPPPHAPKDDAETGPVVTFARSGVAAHWKASSCQSILELAEACDVPVRWSCRTGVSQLRERFDLGSRRLRTGAAGQARGSNLLVCCSQPLRDIVIDL
jgi:hypothetical protein